MEISEDMEARREKLMARLEKRNEERKNVNNDSEAKIEEVEMDELMKEVKYEMDEKKTVNPGKIDRLQKYITFSVGNHRTKAIQNLLEDVRKFKVAQKPVAKFTGFSFSKPKSTPTQKKVEKPEEKQEVPVAEGVSAADIVEHLKNEQKVIHGENGKDLSLKNIENCRLEFDFEPSVVHIRNIRNSTLLFLRCDRSLLIHDCENIHLYVAAQQIRVHTSKDVHLHVATRGTVILEETCQVFMYKYRLTRKNGDPVEAEDNDAWKKPKDFDWLAMSQSPNWSLVPEERWTVEKLSF